MDLAEDYRQVSPDILKGSAQEDKGDVARMQYFIGSIAVGDLLKSTLGPKGMDKLLQPMDIQGPTSGMNTGTILMYLDKYKRDLDRKSHALERDKYFLRQRQDDVDLKENKVLEALRQLPSQQEELDSYKMYLQDKQTKISRMYQDFEQAQSDLMQKMDQCSILERDYKRKLSEYQSALNEIKQRELMLSETTSALSARKLELESLENRILQESEKIKILQEQCETTRLKMKSELRQHNQHILEENENLESKKKKLLEKENMLRSEKAKLDNSRIMTLEFDRKLKEATDLIEYNSKLAEDLKRKDDELKNERDMLSTEWIKFTEATEQLNKDRNEVKSIKRDLSLKAKKLDVSQSQPDMASQIASLNEARLKNMENDLNRKYEHLRQSQEEFIRRQDELNELANHLNKREFGVKSKEHELEKLERNLSKRKFDLDEREKHLDLLRRELDKRSRELELKRDKYRNLESEYNDFKDRMSVFSIERNSLEGRIEQFNAKKMTNEQEVNAINQRLSLREKQISDKYNQLKGKNDHTDLLNKLNSFKKSEHPFPVSDDKALN